MSTVTPNYGFILPGVGDPADEDLWGNELNSNWSSIDTDLKTVADSVATAGRLPIGSIYINADVATNPGSLLGYGTWLQFGAGRVLLGVGTGTDINAHMETFSAGDAGGEYEHTQTIPELASHTHPIATNSNASDGSGYVRSSLGGSSSYVANTSSAGSSSPMPWLQPYITVYIWRRTA